MWLEKAREIAKLKVNETYTKEAPRFIAKRSRDELVSGDLVLRWKSLHKEGLHNKLLKKWMGPFKIVECRQLSHSTNYWKRENTHSAYRTFKTVSRA